MNNIFFILFHIDLYEVFDLCLGILAFLSTLFLGIIGFVYNSRLNKINEKLTSDNLKTFAYSQVDFDKVQYLYRMLDDKGSEIYDPEGFEMIENNEFERLGGQTRFLINIKERNKRPIKNFFIDNLKLEYDEILQIKQTTYNYKLDFKNFSIDNYKATTNYEINKNNYFLTLILNTNIEISENIKKSESIRMNFDLNLVNCFNIETKVKCEVVINKSHNSKTSGPGNTEEYNIKSRLIQYMEVNHI